LPERELSPGWDDEIYGELDLLLEDLP
jgi:hypothetical protein